MSRKSIVAIALCAFLAAFFVLRRASPRPKAAQAASAQRVHWPADRRYTYALSWRATTGGDDGRSTPLPMDSAVDGEIALERAGGTPGHAQVALYWSRIDRFSFTLQGHDAQGDAAEVAKALTGQPVFLEVDARGRISSIAFPPEMAPGARAVLRSLALQLRYTLPETDTTAWEADEQDGLGDVHVRYRSGIGEIARERQAYRGLQAIHGALDGTQKLTGGAVLVLDADGIPESIEETVDASYTRAGSKSPAIRSAWSFTLHRTGQSAAGRGMEAIARRAQAQPVQAPVQDGARDPHLVRAAASPRRRWY